MKSRSVLGWVGGIAVSALAVSAAPDPAHLRIVLAGDSTVTDVAGWAPGFRLAFSPAVECINESASGRSSKSYREEGLWAKVLATPADYVLIQFGANDVPGKGPARETTPNTTYRELLGKFVAEAQARGLRPVLVTALAHRAFGADGQLKADAVAPYAAVAREVAAQFQIPVIDLFAQSRALSARLGREESDLLGRFIPEADGNIKADDTHLGRLGALQLGRWVALDLARQIPAFAPALEAEPAVPVSTSPNPWVRSGQRKEALTRSVVWFENEPLAYLLRRGGTPESAETARLFAHPTISVGAIPEDLVQQYERQHAPDNIRAMARAEMSDAGLIHFYKGLGLNAEKEEMARTRRAIELTHEYGMTACVYIAGTMFAETFPHEVPASVHWLARDGQGRPIPYAPTQTYRHFPSVAEPAYTEYLKGVIQVAVREVHADALMFDNFTLAPEPSSDHSPQALAAFHTFLRRRYPTREAAWRRFGIAEVDWLQAPEWDDPSTPNALATITDPVLQEWVRFRCELLAGYCGQLYDYAKKLNPRVVVGFNLKGLFGSNRIWSSAIYHPLFAGHCDFLVFDTGGYDARIDRSGALVSQIRSYKMARSLQMTSVENHNLTDEVNAAVDMVFNYQKPVTGIGSICGPLFLGGDQVFTPIFEFFRRYDQRYFTNTETVADVAELRTWSSMAYSTIANYIPVTLAEQVLIQHKIPFDLLHEEQIGRLNRYAAVILPAQDSISDATIQTLLAYARQGGTLLLSDNAGAYSETRVRRKRNPLWPARPEGKGRIVWLDRIVPAAGVRGGEGKLEVTVTGPSETRPNAFGPAQWVLPPNHAALAAAITAAVPQGLSLQTGAPLTTVAEIYRRDSSHETLVHFINFDRRAEVPAFPCRARLSQSGPVKSVRLLSPDQTADLALPFQTKDGFVDFTVPHLATYALIAITQRDSAGP